MKLRMTTVERAEMDANIKIAMVALNSAAVIADQAGRGQDFPADDHYTLREIRTCIKKLSDILHNRHDLIKVEGARRDENPEGDRLYNLLALFDTRDGSAIADLVRSAREGYERSGPDMREPDAWQEFDIRIARYEA